MNHTETPTEANRLSAQEVHRRVWEALPWYINGSADANEKQLVEAHLSSCLNCQEELQFQQSLAKGIEQTATPSIDAERGLAQFWSNLAAATSVTPSSTDSANNNEKLLSNGSNKGGKSRWQWGLAAMLVIQFGGLGLLTYQLQKQTNQTALLLNQQAALSASNNYRTLSNEAAQTTSATIRAVLAPSLDMGTLSRQLDALDLQIVAGPNKANIVALAPTTQRFKVEQQVASLRANQGWLLAEIIRPE